ncbi:cytochrome b [Craterilacuibacter sinensis]|uniref:Cytochrome b n=1 Tax=Craterilacuibacter sinensis TaxID=2686017 RepID=A0A845BJY4_9NEIS|nr:cytochrome b [Craterilacuibacter sinensis]MXR35584.1 cytochrome b [Craterilacuibacter sinensis]
MLFNSRHSYGSVARAFHWLSALAVIIVLSLAQIKDFFPRQSEARVELWLWHINFGIIIFLLVLPRIVWRLGNKLPAITPPPSALDMLLAHIIHWTLYALMVITPVFGLWSLQAGDATVHLFSLPLPQLFGVDDALSHDIKEIHETLGNVVLWLMLAHIAAALWHHYRIKDDTLTRMGGQQKPD